MVFISASVHRIAQGHIPDA